MCSDKFVSLDDGLICTFDECFVRDINYGDEYISLGPGFVLDTNGVVIREKLFSIKGKIMDEKTKNCLVLESVL